jgi:hypothetical protein
MNIPHFEKFFFFKCKVFVFIYYMGGSWKEMERDGKRWKEMISEEYEEYE